MNGGEILAFTLDRVPATVSALLEKSGLRLEDVDLFVFHQANRYVLNVLRKACRIPEEKFYVCLRDFGNTVSSTIPIALKRAETEGVIRPGSRLMLVGFGVGYSWGGTLVRWHS